MSHERSVKWVKGGTAAIAAGGVAVCGVNNEQGPAVRSEAGRSVSFVVSHQEEEVGHEVVVTDIEPDNMSLPKKKRHSGSVHIPGSFINYSRDYLVTQDGK